MSLTTRIYIFFFDGSDASEKASKMIAEHPNGQRISLISLASEQRSGKALETLREASLEPEMLPDGRMAPCFLVRDEGAALYPVEDVETVLMLVSR